ncbi:hypothetical protein D6_0245 [Aeromonas phage D6]|uniref:Uncharacterized protein n=1 Tax=Aeromonas phage D6 TaxID=2593322 RepID=A0A514TWL5_9CAUD|nr:hypothetical protein PQC08_gp030 [Aeromonas phage D6]QDJ97404.1 hypothetical protein D6_0245 [Aeromonas phage D6]
MSVESIKERVKNFVNMSGIDVNFNGRIITPKARFRKDRMKATQETARHYREIRISDDVLDNLGIEKTDGKNIPTIAECFEMLPPHFKRKDSIVKYMESRRTEFDNRLKEFLQ